MHSSHFRSGVVYNLSFIKDITPHLKKINTEEYKEESKSNSYKCNEYFGKYHFIHFYIRTQIYIHRYAHMAHSNI